MKNLIAIVSLAVLVVLSASVYAQSKRECSFYTIAKPVQKSRGSKNAKIKVNYEAGKIKVLPSKSIKKRGKAPACMFSLYNYNSQLVHVYADSVYVGTLQPNRVGVVETIGSFSKLYCITDDGQFQWEEPGGCDCIHSFHLRIKDGEGQIIESDM
ncbi:MAG: hypothetical protein ACK45I_11820 [Bacteroidota bacterium]|jgi:hypothetical protein